MMRFRQQYTVLRRRRRSSSAVASIEHVTGLIGSVTTDTRTALRRRAIDKMTRGSPARPLTKWGDAEARDDPGRGAHLHNLSVVLAHLLREHHF